MTSVRADAVIFGGGIAGLWTLARLRNAGYRALLFEADKLGGLQSLASQGIIHGGTKYALSGKITGSSQAIAEMPGRWRDCLAGNGELDLTSVKVLSSNQYLWSTGTLTSNLSGFFAGKLMRSRMEEVTASPLPEPFNHGDFQGHLYRLEEPVLDVYSLIQALVQQVGSWCRRVHPQQLSVEEPASGSFTLVTEQGELTVDTDHLLFTAGNGNEQLLRIWQRKQPEMQRRPLHMLMVKGRLPLLYAHCLGASANPRLTITSYPCSDGETVWYLGGQVAEQGVSRNREEQIAAGKAELAALLPWVDVEHWRWANLRVDRAEPLMPGNRRPEDCYLHREGAVMTAWPTKLAFAPRLADKVLQQLPPPSGIEPDQFQTDGLLRPAIGVPPWEEVQQWS